MHETTLSVALAFGELEPHQAELIAHCYRMLGSPFDAEDAVQEAFAAKPRSLRGYVLRGDAVKELTKLKEKLKGKIGVKGSLPSSSTPFSSTNLSTSCAN